MALPRRVRVSVTRRPDGVGTRPGRAAARRAGAVRGAGGWLTWAERRNGPGTASTPRRYGPAPVRAGRATLAGPPRCPATLVAFLPTYGSGLALYQVG
ncbi:hypothetical protein GCM10023324_31270 [Streptomyces youssoufiensis]